MGYGSTAGPDSFIKWRGRPKPRAHANVPPEGADDPNPVSPSRSWTLQSGTSRFGLPTASPGALLQYQRVDIDDIHPWPLSRLGADADEIRHFQLQWEPHGELGVQGSPTGDYSLSGAYQKHYGLRGAVAAHILDVQRLPQSGTGGVALRPEVSP